MKKILSALTLIVLLSLCLTSCSFGVARPEIKEGRFNVTVTYEQDGEIKKASAVYVCEYDGILWYNINGEPCVNWKESFEGDIKDGGVLPICNTDDGGELYISFLMYPEYFMGDPEYSDFTPLVRAEILYEDDQIEDPEVIAEYGVRLISVEYDEPIKNTYK
jgi:hypothetical protein